MNGKKAKMARKFAYEVAYTYGVGKDTTYKPITYFENGKPVPRRMELCLRVFIKRAKKYGIEWP